MRILSAISSKAKPIIAQGVKRVKGESDSIFLSHTAIGRKIASGISHAKEAVKNRMSVVRNQADDVIADAQQKLNANGERVADKLAEDPEFVKDISRYNEKRGLIEAHFTGRRGVAKGSLTNEKYLQNLIEASGVGPTKLAQIISSDERILSQIKDPDLLLAIKNTKDKCSFSRTLEEAQEVIQKYFPGVNVQKELSAASIGDTYSAVRPDGTKAVVKILKKNVDNEQLELEERIIIRLINELELGTNVQEREKMISMIKNWYKDWADELDYSIELSNNRTLANGASRYRVAKITEISSDNKAVLMDFAHGVKMKELIAILNDYKTSGMSIDDYLDKYATTIVKNPWLADPDKVIKDLPTSVLKTFDEQFMFMKKGQQSLMHGDPHTGNYFITVDEKGCLIPEFIDTGNCVKRNARQIREDVNFFANYFVGNPKGIAEYYVSQCNYTGADKAEVVAKVAREIQNEIFAQKHNVTKFNDFQAYVTYILQRNGLTLLPENATASKAQMQFFTGIAEAGKISGEPFNMLTIIKDIPRAAWGMLKAGVNPWSSIKQALSFAFDNVQKTASVAGQFIVKKGNIDSMA